MEGKPSAEYTIFLSSPSDVKAERRRVHAVARELSASLDRVRLRVLDYERDTAPDIRESAQDVVDRDMPAPYDIYVGIMWGKLGTPTGEHSSGTVSEFEGALRWRRAGRRIRIMFYFSEQPLRPADTDQLPAVRAFRRRIERKGLIGEFQDTDHFEEILREDLKFAVARLVEADAAAVGADQTARESEENEAPGADFVELRLRLEAKLTWLCKRLFGTPEQPAYATLGSLRVDGYLTPEQARVATRVMIGDAGSDDTGDPGERARFRAQAEKVVAGFRATVFDAHVRKLAERAGWRVEDFEEPTKRRADFIIRRDDEAIRVAPRFTTKRSSDLVASNARRLARRRGDPAGITDRLVVVPVKRPAAVEDGCDVLGLPAFEQRIGLAS